MPGLENWLGLRPLWESEQALAQVKNIQLNLKLAKSISTKPSGMLPSEVLENRNRSLWIVQARVY